MSILDNDRIADKIGAALGEGLNLKRDREYKDRWVTGWGTKTNQGLARTVAAITEAATIAAEAESMAGKSE